MLVAHPTRRESTFARFVRCLVLAIIDYTLVSRERSHMATAPVRLWTPFA